MVPQAAGPVASKVSTARARLLKPGFFKNEVLARLSFAHRLLFEGLWTLADREGRLENRPEWIKAEIFPYDPDVTVDAVVQMLRDLTSSCFVVNYESHEHRQYLHLPTFLNHQTPHHREPPSRFPAPPRGKHKTKARPKVKPEAQPEAEPKSSPSDPVYGVRCTGSETETETLSGVARRASLSPPAASDPFLNDAITDRAGRFVERYQQLYVEQRKGARYAVKPARDYAAAVSLCQTWADDARLDQLAIVFLNCDNKFAEEGSRTIPQFLALASWCDSRLVEWEAAQVGTP